MMIPARRSNIFSESDSRRLLRLGLTVDQIAEVEKKLSLLAALMSESAARNKVLRVLSQGAKDTPKGRAVREQVARSGASMEPCKREVSARLIEAGGEVENVRTWRLALSKFRREIKRTGQGRRRASAQAIAILDSALRAGRASELAREIKGGRNGKGKAWVLDQYKPYTTKAPLRRIHKTLRISWSPASAYSEIMRVCLGTDPERAIRAYKVARRVWTKAQAKRIEQEQS